MMLPKAGVFAHLQADVVAKNIVRKIKGKNADEEFCADGYCMLEAGEDYESIIRVPFKMIEITD